MLAWCGVGTTVHGTLQSYASHLSCLIAHIWNGPRRSWTLGNVLLGTVFWLLATNFICTHLYDGAISVCMHALYDWKPLGTGYDLICEQRGCFSLGVNHICYVNRMDRTWNRAQLFDVSKNGKPANETGHFPLDSFWKQSYEGYPTLGWAIHTDLALPSPHGFDIV